MKSPEYKLSHLRNLIALAKIDKNEDPRELDFIHSIMEREELTDEDFEFCNNNANSIPYTVPESFGERVEFLHDMIKLTLLDGDIDDRELDLCKECADMMKIPSRNSEDLVESMISLIRKELEDSGMTFTHNRAYNPTEMHENNTTNPIA